MPTVKEVIQDKEFLTLPQPEQIKVLSNINTDFAGLSGAEQAKALAGLTEGRFPDISEPFIKPELEAGGEPSLEPALRFGTGTVVPMVTSTAGTILATPAGPAAAFGGGLAGNFLGKQATKALNAALDIKDPTKTKFTVEGTVEDAINATVEELAGLAFTKAGQKIAAPMAKRITAETIDLVNRFRRLGVEPTPAQVIKSAGLESAENILDRFFLTASSSRAFRKEQLETLVRRRDEAVRRALDGEPKEAAESIGRELVRLIDNFVESNVAGSQAAKDRVRNRFLLSVGSRETYDSLGNFQVNLLKKFGDDFRAAQEIMFNDIPTTLPQGVDTLVDATKLTTLIEDILEDPFNTVPENTFRKVLSSISSVSDPKAVNKFIRWEDLDAFRRTIGRGIGRARKPGDIVQDATAGQLSRLYSSIYETIDDFGDAGVGAGARDALKAAAKYSTDTYKFLKDPLVKRMFKTETGQAKIFNMVVHPKGSSLVKVLKRNLGPEGTDKLLDRAVHEILQTDSGVFDVATGRRVFNKFGRETLEELSNPRFVRDLERVFEEGAEIDAIPTSNAFLQSILKKAGTNPADAAHFAFKTQNSEAVAQLQRITNTRVYNNMKSLFMEDMLGDVSQPVSPTKIANAVETLSPSFANRVFTGAERQFIEDLSAVSEAMKSNEATGKGLAFLGILGGMFVYNPVKATYVAITGKEMGKLYFSKPVRDQLLKTAQLSVGTREGLRAAGRLVTMLGLDATESKE
jgi:hypothetical protein